tara:strand:- start:7014 stop:7439 length:426 start_codon:yes stop_codon:yes gene_type:complete
MRLDNLETKQKKTTSKLDEGLRENDLNDLVLPLVSIDDFEPKSGDDSEVVVVTFRVKDDKPAEDLASFIEKGTHDILDTEVSPSVDDDGNYLVFVEMKREADLFENVKKLIGDVMRLVNIDTWKFQFHKGATIEISKEQLK